MSENSKFADVVGKVFATVVVGAILIAFIGVFYKFVFIPLFT